MKYVLVALLVSLYSVGHASKKAHHSLRNLDDYEESVSEIDDYEESVIEIPDGIRCHMRLISCNEPIKLTQYQSGRNLWDPMSLFSNLIKVGSKQVCSDLLSATQCLQESLDDPICQTLDHYMKGVYIRFITHAERLCVDKFIELERNWLCLVNVTKNDDLNQCWDLQSEDLYEKTCNAGPLADCVADWYKSNSACEEEGLELIRDLYSSYKDIYRFCKEQEPESEEMDADVSEDK